jgi:hypothetical protein
VLVSTTATWPELKHPAETAAYARAPSGETVRPWPAPPSGTTVAAARATVSITLRLPADSLAA